MQAKLPPMRYRRKPMEAKQARPNRRLLTTTLCIATIMALITRTK